MCPTQIIFLHCLVRKQFLYLESQQETKTKTNLPAKQHLMATETQTSTVNNHIDYKNISRLKANVNPHARMMSRRRTNMSAKGQRNFAKAIKRARFMALMPYIQR